MFRKKCKHSNVALVKRVLETQTFEPRWLESFCHALRYFLARLACWVFWSEALFVCPPQRNRFLLHWKCFSTSIFTDFSDRFNFHSLSLRENGCFLCFPSWGSSARGAKVDILAHDRRLSFHLFICLVTIIIIIEFEWIVRVSPLHPNIIICIFRMTFS